MTIDTQRSTQSVQKLVASYMIMLVYGIVVTLTASLAAWVCNEFYPLGEFSVRFLEYLGYIAWSASLGALGPQGWRESHLVQKIDKQLANSLSLVGIFSFVMARQLIPLYRS